MRSASEQLEHLERAVELAGVEVSEVVLPAEHHVVLAGLRLHYLDWGDPARPPLLFLHGGALTARTWDLVCLALRDRYHCLALDQRGHGDSEWSPAMEYTPADHLGDLEAVADRLGLDSFVMVGQSLGGMNALGYAIAHPRRLAGLVLVDVGPEPNWRGASRIADFVLGTDGLSTLDDYVERARAFNPLRDPDLLRASLRHNLRELPDGGWTWKYDRRHLSPEYFQRFKGWLASAHRGLDRVSCPTLVVRGALSDVLAEEDAQRFAAGLPDGRAVTVDGAGHTVQGDNPRGLACALSEFLAGLPEYG